MYKLLVPNDPNEASDLSIDINEGPFKGFPHYATSGGIINAEKANVLADLTGWVILNNKQLFQSIFQ